jgi:NADH dehydrogenase [ubiquinone] 1 alpha subcomplex assembly factor 7
MSTLKSRLIQRIARHGPMTLAEYMTECLLHPELGYYTRQDPLGRSGDFITAPEVSQMFGELIGLWLAQVWLDQGAPEDADPAGTGPRTRDAHGRRAARHPHRPGLSRRDAPAPD